ncbi:glutathione transferase [Aureococcus anophagefferens]|nr:glutathione transferase [Aureococcus anophagefferens]
MTERSEFGCSVRVELRLPDLALSGSDDGDWHHICNTYNGTRWVLYFDGDEKHSVKVDLETGDDNPLTIGVRYSSGYTGYFSGSIDEVSLIVHYSFDDGTANGHHDGSLDGTIVGASATTGPDGSGALSFDGVDDYVEFPSAVTADILGGSADHLPLGGDRFLQQRRGLFDYGTSSDLQNFALRVAGTDGTLKVQLWGADTDVALSGSDAAAGITTA